MLDFVVIKYKDKGIYLGIDEDRTVDANKVYYKWFKDINASLWFNCQAEAEKFAKYYFKNFSAYEYTIVNGAKYL